MMNQDQTTRFRSLLKRFYDGDTSVTAELTRIAMEADPDTLPADLRADTLMLRDMASYRADAARFSTSLDAITGTAAPHRSGRRFLRAISLSGVAAAMALILLTWHPGQHPGRTAPSATSSPAPAAQVASVAAPDSLPVAPLPRRRPIAQASPAPAAHAAPALPTATPAIIPEETVPASQETQTASLPELTDPRMASEILTSSLQLCADNLTTAGQCIDLTGELLSTSFNQLFTLL